MDISYIIRIGIIWAFVFLFLCRRYGSRQWWKPILGAMLLSWAMVVLYATVFCRESGTDVSFLSVPLHSYREVMAGGNPEILRSNFMNAVLFFPGGLLLGALLPRRWPKSRSALTVIALSLCFSSAIEYVQFTQLLGQGEIDDVIHNTLGAACGYWTLSLGAD